MCKPKYSVKTEIQIQNIVQIKIQSVARYNSNVIRLANNSLVDTRGLYQVTISQQVENAHENLECLKAKQI